MLTITIGHTFIYMTSIDRKLSKKDFYIEFHNF